MSPNKPILEDVIREYLNQTQDFSQNEVLHILLDYMNLLFEDSEEPIYLEDFTAFEGDDFLNFYLPDNFDGKELKRLQSQSQKTIQQFINYCKKKKFLTKEALEEWKEVFK
ncbi:MAG: hypothetical protein N3A69_17145 [Leptospiraceae bacterium]|nr:hypothetical protein [Leptospiraceae bacterium]